MKKNIAIINKALMLLLLVLISACKSETIKEELRAEFFGEKILITTTKKVDVTRTTMVDSNSSIDIYWENGDNITLYAGGKTFNYHASIQKDDNTVVFTINNHSDERLSALEGETVYALRTTNAKNDITLVNNHFVSNEDYGNIHSVKPDDASDAYFYSVGTVKDGKLELNFKHMFAYLKVTVKKEQVRNYDYICVLSPTNTIVPSKIDFDLTTNKFSYESIEDGANTAYVTKKQVIEDGEYYTAYIPVLPSDGTNSYHVYGINAKTRELSDAIMVIDDPEEGLAAGKTFKMHVTESYTYTKDKSADGRHAILEQAKEGRGISIMFIGKGFTDKDIESGKYTKAMTREMERLFSVEPFKSYRKYFTSHIVYRVSDSNNLTNVANRPELEEELEWNSSLKYISKCISGYDVDTIVRTILVYNSNYIGRSETMMHRNGHFLALIMGNDKNLVVHEAGGHGFGKLGDEYVEFGHGPSDDDKAEIDNKHSYNFYANIDTNKEHPVWEKFIVDERYKSEGISVYEGAHGYPYGVYRPTLNSVMNDHTESSMFNAPSREAIYKNIMTVAFADYKYDENEFYKYDKINLATGSEARTREHNKVAGKKHIYGRKPVMVKGDVKIK